MPETTGELLAWLTALFTLVTGLFVMVAPGILMRAVGLKALAGSGTSEVRAIFGGLMGGLGLACLLLAQPLLYIALGLAFAMAVVGRLISFIADRSLSPVTMIATGVEIAAAFFPLAYALGFIS